LVNRFNDYSQANAEQEKRDFGKRFSPGPLILKDGEVADFSVWLFECSPASVAPGRGTSARKGMQPFPIAAANRSIKVLEYRVIIAAPIKMIIHVERPCADTQSELVFSDSVTGHGPLGRPIMENHFLTRRAAEMKK
jgi:hypothetical protein